MKTINSYREFVEEIQGVMTYTTAFVYDTPNNRNVYVSGEIDEDSIAPFYEATIKVYNLEELPEIKDIMQDNFLAELKPAEGIEDDGYNDIARKFESNEGCIYVAEKDGETVYMLNLGERIENEYECTFVGNIEGFCEPFELGTSEGLDMDQAKNEAEHWLANYNEKGPALTSVDVYADGELLLTVE